VIRVALADDQPLVRAGFAMILSAEEDIEVVGEAGDGSAALTLVRQTEPDVILMDIRMPEGDGLDATRRIIADPGLRRVRVLILTTFELDEYVFEALRCGASGFLVKHTEPAELVRAVRQVHATAHLRVRSPLPSPGAARLLVAGRADGARARSRVARRPRSQQP
jgi:DNA-binding NarL/FixJ family response regulator